MAALKWESPEWIAEAQQCPALLQAALDNPSDPVARDRAFESLRKLGIIVPIKDEATQS